MGMFDTITCEYPLPGTQPEFIKPDSDYQTKDLDCSLAHYHINQAGDLILKSVMSIDGGPAEENKPVNFTGEVHFYTNNIGASGVEGTYTKDGSDAESVSYNFTFLEGKVTKAEQSGYKREPALSEEERKVLWKEVDPPVYKKTSYLKRKLYYVGYGTGGAYGKVVAETESNICLKFKQKFGGKDLEVYYKRDFGRNLFKSKKQAKTYKKALKNLREERKKRYAELLAAKLEAKK